MKEINWKQILWTNSGVYLSARQTLKSVLDCVCCNSGEALRFDLYVFTVKHGALVGTYIANLHWKYRGLGDKAHFQTILENKQREDPKATFRIIGWCADVENES